MQTIPNKKFRTYEDQAKALCEALQEYDALVYQHGLGWEPEHPGSRWRWAISESGVDPELFVLAGDECVMITRHDKRRATPKYVIRTERFMRSVIEPSDKVTAIVGARPLSNTCQHVLGDPVWQVRKYNRKWWGHEMLKPLLEPRFQPEPVLA